MTDEEMDILINEIENLNTAGASIPEGNRLILVIGDSPYKPSVATNVSSFGLYTTFGFNEVAFLCDKETLDEYSIMGILMGSMDDSAVLLHKIMSHGKMNKLAEYLLYEKKVMLVNAYGQQNKIDNLLDVYKNHLIFFCPIKKKIKISEFSKINITQSAGKFDHIFSANHPGSKSYSKGYINSCKTYFERTYQDSTSNLNIQNFKVF